MIQATKPTLGHSDRQCRLNFVHHAAPVLHVKEDGQSADFWAGDCPKKMSSKNSRIGRTERPRNIIRPNNLEVIAH